MRVLNIVIVLVMLLVSTCTTVRPLTPSEIKQFRSRDTVVMKPVVITNPSGSQPAVVQRIHDTLLIREETIKMQPVPVTDTAALEALMARYNPAGEVQKLQQALSNLQAYMIARSHEADMQQAELRAKLEVRSQQATVAQKQAEASKVIIYDVPKYLFIAVIVFIGIIFLYLRYKEGELKRKQELKNVNS